MTTCHKNQSRYTCVRGDDVALLWLRTFAGAAFMGLAFRSPARLGAGTGEIWRLSGAVIGRMKFRAGASKPAGRGRAPL